LGPAALNAAGRVIGYPLKTVVTVFIAADLSTMMRCFIPDAID